MYTYPPEKKNGQPTRMAYLLAAFLRGLCHSNQLLLQHFVRCCRSCYLVAWLILKRLGWLTSPFRKESFSHIEQWFAINLPDRQTAMRDGSNLNCLLAAKQSEHWPVLCEICKVEACFWPQKNLPAHLQRLRCATLRDGGTGRWTASHGAKFCGPEALPLASPLTFC